MAAAAAPAIGEAAIFVAGVVAAPAWIALTGDRAISIQISNGHDVWTLEYVGDYFEDGRFDSDPSAVGPQDSGSFGVTKREGALVGVTGVVAFRPRNLEDGNTEPDNIHLILCFSNPFTGPNCFTAKLTNENIGDWQWHCENTYLNEKEQAWEAEEAGGMACTFQIGSGDHCIAAVNFRRAE